MFAFLLDDVGIPLNYRHMPGFGVHTMKVRAVAARIAVKPRLRRRARVHSCPAGARLRLQRLTASRVAQLVNAAGRETYVKFHWIPKCGTTPRCPAAPFHVLFRCTRRPRAAGLSRAVQLALASSRTLPVGRPLL